MPLALWPVVEFCLLPEHVDAIRTADRQAQYVFLLKIMREHAASNDCSSILALVANRFAIVDPSLLWMKPLRKFPTL